MQGTADSNHNNMEEGLEDGEYRMPSTSNQGEHGGLPYSKGRRREGSERPIYGYGNRDGFARRDVGVDVARYYSASQFARRGPSQRHSAEPLRMGRRGPPHQYALSARSPPPSYEYPKRSSYHNDGRGGSGYSSPRPRFSMTYRDGETRHYIGNSKISIREGQPFSRFSSERTPFSNDEYQDRITTKTISEPQIVEKEHVHESKEEKIITKPQCTADILKSIKTLDEKKEDVIKTVTETDEKIAQLQDMLPKVAKKLEKISSTEPMPPSPCDPSASVSAEDQSTSDYDYSNDDPELSKSKKRKQKGSRQSNSKNLQRFLECIPPEQRCLVSKLGNALKEKTVNCLNDSILRQNKQIARKSAQRFSGVSPESMDGVKEHLAKVFAQDIQREQHSGVYNVLKKDLIALLKQYLISGVKYRFAYEKWRGQENTFHSRHLLGSPVHGSATHVENQVEPTSPMGRASSRGRNRAVVRSDLEERVAIATLQAVESVKAMTNMPTQRIYTVRSARWMKNYYDWNGLIKNPGKEFEEDLLKRPWSKPEKDAFAQKFLLYHKDFNRISIYLPNRTIPEIVKHYYSIQRSEEFEMTRRKWQLRKRREKAEQTAAIQREGMRHAMAPASLIAKIPQDASIAQPTDSNPEESLELLSSGSRKRKGKKAKNSSKKPPRMEMYYEERCPIFLSNVPRNLRNSKRYPRKDLQWEIPDSMGQTSTKMPSGPLQSAPVGRGRLPHADTDKRYIEAVKLYGKDFESISSHMNRTIEATRKYWERHSERLKLDLLVSEDSPKPCSMDMNAWDPLFELLNDKETDDSIVIEMMEAIPPEEWHKLQEILVLTDSPSAKKLLHMVSHRNSSEPKVVIEMLQGVQGLLGHQDATPSTSSTTVLKQKGKPRRPVWNDADKEALFAAFKIYGRSWKKLQEAVPSKTMTQIKNFYQNYKFKYKELSENLGMKRSASSEDIDLEHSSGMSKKSKSGGEKEALNIPQEMLSVLPDGILDQMESKMTDEQRKQFNSLMSIMKSGKSDTSASKDPRDKSADQ